VVRPTIVYPWRERISAARKAENLLALRQQLLSYRVLDPACGSGNGSIPKKWCLSRGVP